MEAAGLGLRVTGVQESELAPATRASSAALRRDRAALYIALALSGIYAAMVCWNGIPSLRHDWAWPVDRYGFVNLIVGSTSGWSTSGIGAPAAYPGAYILGTCLGIVGLALGPLAALVLFTYGTALCITIGARGIGSRLGASLVQIAGIEIFALFNPWVYNKTVAGHLYMLLAYGACCLLLSELLRSTPRQHKIVLYLVLALPQLQFFVIAFAAVTIHALVRRAFLAWLTGAAISSPVWIGILLDRGSLLRTPYSLTWQASQSVAPVSAPVLMGYFAHYALQFQPVQTSAVWLLVACASAAVITSRRRAFALGAAIVTLLFIVFSMGTRSVFGAWYTAIVLHVPESGLFRELYDVLGFTAIGYLALLGCLPSRLRAVAALTLAGAIIVASGWLMHPPTHYWVPQQQVPLARVEAPPNTRFALMPPYQPVRFNDRGSGVDPDGRTHPANVTPLNGYLAAYPVNTALSTYAAAGDVKPLQALSVSLVVERPWLQSDSDALRFQGSGMPTVASAGRERYRRIAALPEVTMQTLPAVASLANVLGAGNVFFGDARATYSNLAPPAWRTLPRFIPAKASNAIVDAADGWTDARFLFAAVPELGQGLGGAATTNSRTQLAVAPAMQALVNVTGRLVSQNGDTLSRTTKGYQWIYVPSEAHAVRCEGRCVVVGEAPPARIPPPNPSPRSYTTPSFVILTPWLVRVAVPARSLPALRYNVAYDPNWTAYAQGRPAVHVRIDATVNGWLLAQDKKPYIVYLYHRAALIQAVAEIVGVLWLLIVAATAWRLSLFRKDRPTV